MLKSIVSLILVLAVSASVCIAQTPSAQVRAYLGSIADQSAPKGEVTYLFKDQTGKPTEMGRTGDGVKTWMQLLAASTFFSDTDQGILQGIYTTGTKVKPSPDYVQPKPVAKGTSAVPIPDGAPISFWDNFLPLNELDGYKANTEQAILETGRQVIPRLDFLGYIGWRIVFPILVAFFILFYWMAKLSFNEAAQSSGRMIFMGKDYLYWGNRARYGCFVIVSAVCLVYIANGLLYDFFAGNSLWLWVAKSAGKASAGYYFAIWAVPNPPKIHNTTTGGGRGLGRGQDPFNNPLIEQ